MKELVYNTGSQVTPDNNEKKKALKDKVSKISFPDLVGITTGAVSAFALLDKTDLKSIAQKITGIVKLPWVAAGIVAIYIMLEVKTDEGAVE